MDEKKKRKKKDARSVGRSGEKVQVCSAVRVTPGIVPACCPPGGLTTEREREEGIFFSCFPSFRLEEGGEKKEKRKRSLHPEVLCVDSQRPCFAVTS